MAAQKINKTFIDFFNPDELILEIIAKQILRFLFNNKHT